VEQLVVVELQPVNENHTHLQRHLAELEQRIPHQRMREPRPLECLVKVRLEPVVGPHRH